MTTPDSNWRAAQASANTAALQARVKDYQSSQLKSLAVAAVPLAVAATLSAKDRLRAVESEFAARDADQLFQIRKQQWITNKLLEGWTRDEVDEEITAGEALVAAETPPPATDPFPLGAALFLVLAAVGVVIALVYGFTHPNDGVTSALGALTHG